MAQHNKDDNVGHFNDKENYLHDNYVPRTPSTENRYEELDVSELNMKLRYSVTPISKSHTATENKNFEFTNNTFDCENGNMTRSLNTCTKNDTGKMQNMTRSLITTFTKNDTGKMQKTLPLQTRQTDFSQIGDANRNVLQPIDAIATVDKNVTTNDIDKNISLPSSSSSMAHTPEATTPTEEIPKSEDSPIMRGLKSILNVFRPSQSPIPGEEDTAKLGISSPPIVNSPNNMENNQAISISTPLVGHTTKYPVSRRTTPNRDSVVFNDDLEKELEWTEDSMVILSHEKVPIHKLFPQIPKASHNKTLDFVTTMNNDSARQNKEVNLNSSVEYMDISYNDTSIINKTAPIILDVVNKTYNESDCEITFTDDESFQSPFDIDDLDLLSFINNLKKLDLNASDAKSADLSAASIETTKHVDASGMFCLETIQDKVLECVPLATREGQDTEKSNYMLITTHEENIFHKLDNIAEEIPKINQHGVIHESSIESIDSVPENCKLNDKIKHTTYSEQKELAPLVSGPTEITIPQEQKEYVAVEQPGKGKILIKNKTSELSNTSSADMNLPDPVYNLESTMIPSIDLEEIQKRIMIPENSNLPDHTPVVPEKNHQEEESSDMPPPNQENVESWEMFIDAETFDFFLNKKQANAVSESRRKSLSLKFDPLFAKRLSSDGVLSTHKQVKTQVKQTTSQKDEISPHVRVLMFDNKSSPVAGPSNINVNQEMGFNSTTEDSYDDLNVTVSKPMIVNPAINQVLTPRTTTITPLRSNQYNLESTMIPSIDLEEIQKRIMIPENSNLPDHTPVVPEKNHQGDESSDMPPPNQENVEGGEMFIDTETFDFFLNKKQANAVSESRRKSLFLKFDPLFAKRLSSDGVLPTHKQVKTQVKQTTSQKDEISPLVRVKIFDNKLSPVAGPSNINVNQEMGFNSTTEDSYDDLNVTVSKPIIVNPAINQVLTPRTTTITPLRSNRQSRTFTSPASAFIDRLLSISFENSMSMSHDITVAEVRGDNESDFALTQLRELLDDKEISVYNLRIENKELQSRLATLEDEKDKINKKLAKLVEEHERTLTSLITGMEKEKKQHAEERIQLIKDRDEQTAHLASMEVSFSDLHSKYEKSKQVIFGLKSNEDSYKKTIKEFEENLAKMHKNYELLKEHATSKLNYANEELQKINRAHESDVLKLNAMIKRKELHITSLEERLQQMTNANVELTAICDDLISRVG